MESCERKISSIYLSTFNMNGKDLSLSDVQKWLLDSPPSSSALGSHKTTPSIHGADLVILSLQECPTCPFSNSERNEEEQMQIPCILAMGPTEDDATRMNDTLPSLIQQALSIHETTKNSPSDHVLLADLAMGEEPTTTTTTPSCSPFKKDNIIFSDDKASKKEMKLDKWYGFLRLIIFAKLDVVEFIRSHTKCGVHPVVPILVPTGHKRISTYIDKHTAKRRIYQKPELSPDKGGVCIAIPSIHLLICSVHLFGTNKYHTMEASFDKIRIDQLQTIGKNCQDALSSIHDEINRENKNPSPPLVASNSSLSPLEEYTKIIIGDLNFRVEICTHEIDKGRGGRDYQEVHKILQSASKEKLQKLFWGHDRLVKLLLKRTNTSSSTSYCHDKATQLHKDQEHESDDIPLLCGVQDVLMHQYDNTTTSKMDIYPTFTFEIDTKKEQEEKRKEHILNKLKDIVKRNYSDKRTPSWTDRILIEDSVFQGLNLKINSLDANYKISTSDHVPVTCFIQA